MITSRQAVERINARYERLGSPLRITMDTFLHKAQRSNIPRERHGKYYYYDSRVVDAMEFRVNKKAIHYPPPMRVHTANDLEELSRQYGTLVDLEGLLQEIEQRFHIAYSRDALKQRIYRKTIKPVAYFGPDKKRHYWFPVEQLKYSIFHGIPKDN